MQWTDNFNANFTWNHSSPWIPIHPNYTTFNVEKQNERIRRFNQLVLFRNNNLELDNVGKHGNYLFHYIDDNEIVLERYFDRGNQAEIRFRYVLFANFGKSSKTKDFSEKFRNSFIRISSNSNRSREFLYFKSLRLDPGEALIVEVE